MTLRVMKACHTSARVLALSLAFLLFCSRPAWAEDPLYLQEPFDQITLTEEGGGGVIQVRLLDLPDRRVPATPPAGEKLNVRLLDQPDKLFELEWRSVEKIELFEVIVLKKANELLAQGQLEEAYRYFRFLFAKFPKLAGRAERCITSLVVSNHDA